jgi:quinate dehydrogenase
MAHFLPPDPSSLERVAYLVGYPIAHSLSPLLHHTIYSSIGKSWGQTLYESPDLRSSLEHIKSDPKFFGSGITMPFKVAVIPYLDELSPEGEAIGAINTIYLKTDDEGRRKFCGTNTDCIGIRDVFLHNVEDPPVFRGRPALIIGGGGTSRAAVYALQNSLGCSPIYMINRDAREVDAVINECNAHGFGGNIIHVSTVGQAEKLAPPGAVVSAVPDFTPVTPEEKTAREVLEVFLQSPQKGALLEMCYHPSPKTEISGLATQHGWQVIIGTEAMIGQGLEQARLWSGIEIGPKLRQAAREAVQNAIKGRHRL